MNNFNEMFEKYAKSGEKPDKKYSILPTVLSLLLQIEGKTVVDLGCGNGFFSRAIINAGAKKVYGIDSSERQIELANKQKTSGEEYMVGDLFSFNIPKCDVINAPFVLNYSSSLDEMARLFQTFDRSLTPNGRLIAVVDLPKPYLNEHQIAKNRNLGAVKMVNSGRLLDGAKIKMDLFNLGDYICTLESRYYSPHSIEEALVNAGLNKIKWHSPIVSSEGIKMFGENFWEGYSDLCELGYLTAEKMGGD